MYIDLDYANTYITGCKQDAAAWTAASAESKNAAIEEASHKVDRYPLIGRPFTRGVAYPRNTYDLDGTTYLYQTPPEPVKMAIAEEAFAIITTGKSARIKAQAQGVEEMTVQGVAKEVYRKRDLRFISQEAKEIMWPYGVGQVVIC